MQDMGAAGLTCAVCETSSRGDCGISIDINKHDNIDVLIESMRTSENTLKGIAESLRPYYEQVSDYNEKAINKFLDQEGKAILTELKELLSNINDWNEDSIDKVLKEYQQENNCPVPKHIFSVV